MLASDRGLVLRCIPLRETSTIVSVLARCHGRLRLVARGVRGVKSRAGSSLESGNEIDFVFSLRPGAELGTLREVALVRPWVAGLDSLEPVAVAWSAIELLERLLPEGAPEDGLLEDVWGYLEALQRRPERGGAVLLFYAFEIRLLERMGHSPELSGCRACGREPRGTVDLDPLEGNWVCGDCREPGSRGIRLPPEVIAVLIHLQEHPWEALHMETTAATRRNLGRALHRLLASHLDRYRYPRSLGLLKKVDRSGVRSAPDPEVEESPQDGRASRGLDSGQ